MIWCENVSAVLVTRGNVALDEILSSLPFDDVIVWDNSVEEDLAVYGRYEAIGRARHPVIYTQDDDVVLEPESFEALLADYEPGVVTANMSEHHQLHTRDSVLVGFGAIFDRDLPEEAFASFWTAVSYGQIPPVDSELVHRTCDVVFTALTPRKAINVPYRYLPCASDPDRMSRQPGFAVERERILQLARRLV